MQARIKGLNHWGTVCSEPPFTALFADFLLALGLDGLEALAVPFALVATGAVGATSGIQAD